MSISLHSLPHLLISVTLAMFMLRHIRFRWPRLERCLAVVCVLAILAMALVPADRGQLARTLVALPVFVIATSMIWFVARHAWRQASMSADALLLSLLYLTLVTAMELLPVSAATPATNR
ncbi:MAG: hypothetical protein WCI73_15700, partial [Phycisphaerae bacterium]